MDADEDELEKAVYVQKVTNLLSAVIQNYEFIFITPHNKEYAAKLNELILIAIEAKDLRIVVETTEYLGEFKQNLIISV
tara:strand:+ start:1013 stop:1249 length:237 start_codon:yes stop_codon:yes gene_type:complete